MAKWTYRVADLLTDVDIDEFDIPGASFDDRIGQAGAFDGTLEITDKKLGARARAAFRENRSVVHVYRNGRFWCGPYFVWRARPAWSDTGRVSLPVQAAGLEYYLSRRHIRSTISYSNTEQLAIARALVTHMQAVRAEGDLNIQVGTETSGVLRDRTYYGEESASYLQRLTELSNVIDGFEFRIAALGEDRVRTLLLGYPRLGRATPEFVLTMPGPIRSGSIEQDGFEGATSFLGRGDSIEDAADPERYVPLLSDVVYREDLLADGWPLLDRVDDYQGVVVKATLDEHVEHNAERYGGSVEVPAVTVRLPEDDSLTFGNLGDPVRTIILNEYWPLDDEGAPTFTRMDRIVGMKITPAGIQGGDAVSLTLEAGTGG